MSRRIDALTRLTVVLVAVLGTGAGCVAPTTQLGAVSPELVRAEQLRQRQLVIESGIGCGSEWRTNEASRPAGYLTLPQRQSAAWVSA